MPVKNRKLHELINIKTNVLDYDNLIEIIRFAKEENMDISDAIESLILRGISDAKKHNKISNNSCEDVSSTLDDIPF